MKLRFIYLVFLSLICANVLGQDTSDEDYYNLNTVSPNPTSVSPKKQEVTTPKIKQTTPKIKQAPEKAKLQANFEIGTAYYFGIRYLGDFSPTLGCRINSHFYLGAGTCLLFYEGHYALPICIDARWYMLKRPFTPYLDLKVGASSFLLYNPAIGITQKVGHSTNLNLSLGLAMQHYYGHYNYYYGYYSPIVYGVELKFGVELY